MPRAIEPAKIPVPQTINRVHSSKKNKLNTTYNQHAKNGFKYWYQEQNKPMDRKYPLVTPSHWMTAVDWLTILYQTGLVRAKKTPKKQRISRVDIEYKPVANCNEELYF